MTAAGCPVAFGTRVVGKMPESSPWQAAGVLLNASDRFHAVQFERQAVRQWFSKQSRHLQNNQDSADTEATPTRELVELGREASSRVEMARS